MSSPCTANRRLAAASQKKILPGVVKGSQPNAAEPESRKKTRKTARKGTKKRPLTKAASERGAWRAASVLAKTDACSP
jgi:hypothetical protein